MPGGGPKLSRASSCQRNCLTPDGVAAGRVMPCGLGVQFTRSKPLDQLRLKVGVSKPRTSSFASTSFGVGEVFGVVFRRCRYAHLRLLA